MTAAAPTAGERSLTLYELTGHYAELKAIIEALETDERDAAGEIDSLGEALAVLTGAIEQKADGIAHLHAQTNAEADWLEHEAEVFQAEANRLRSRAAVRRHANERLRQYLAAELGKLGPDTQKIKLQRFTVTLAKQGKDRAVVVDEALVPEGFRRATLKLPYVEVPAELRQYIVGTDVPKRELQDALDADGVIPPGVEAQPGTRALRIY